MFGKKQVQESIKRIDANIAQLNGTRQAHLTLVSDMQLIQKVCMEYFEQAEAAKTPDKEPENE
jgi:hypothetical protein